MSPQDDLDRLKQEYALRATRTDYEDRYNPLNPAYQYAMLQRQRDLVVLLRALEVTSLRDKTALDVGCGSGSLLMDLLTYRMPPENIYGCDIIESRLKRAHKRLPHVPVMLADGQTLPFADTSFDLVFQYTVFSSILDEAIRKNIAREMVRVLKKPGGIILWYDFWLNPVNPNTIGLGKMDIESLFPGATFRFRRVTLAPPIARRLVPFSWTLGDLLEQAKILNTHYLTAILPAQPTR